MFALRWAIGWRRKSPPPPDAVSVLVDGRSDPEPLVRGHAAWALGEVGSPEPRQALGRLLESEPEPWILEEASTALVHARFGTIHPCADGNGRTGRALIHVVLRRPGLAPTYVLPLSVVLDRLRAMPNLSPFTVVVVSAHDVQSNRDRALKAGAKAFVQKPWIDDELLALIARLPGRPEKPEG